jgi:hypothetical protein
LVELRKMKRFSITAIFWALVGVFVAIQASAPIIKFLVPEAIGRYILPPILFISWTAFFTLGLVLLISIVKRKAEEPQGRLKKFLLLTGVFAVAFPVFTVLHNLVYGLFIYFFGQDFWERTGLSDEPVFFFLTLIAGLGFLIGAIGSIVLFIKRRKRF